MCTIYSILTDWQGWCHNIMGPPTSGMVQWNSSQPERRAAGMVRKRKGRSKLIPVEEILKGVFAGIEMPEDLELKNRIFSAWDEIARDAAPYANPFRFRDSTLIVEVTSPVWLTELSMRKRDLLNRMEKVAGEKVVEDIRFEIKKKRRE